MKYKMTGVGELAAAFGAGMLVATALGGGIDAAGAKTLGAATLFTRQESSIHTSHGKEHSTDQS